MPRKTARPVILVIDMGTRNSLARITSRCAVAIVTQINITSPTVQKPPATFVDAPPTNTPGSTHMLLAKSDPRKGRKYKGLSQRNKVFGRNSPSQRSTQRSCLRQDQNLDQTSGMKCITRNRLRVLRNPHLSSPTTYRSRHSHQRSSCTALSFPHRSQWPQMPSPTQPMAILHRWCSRQSVSASSKR